MKTKILFFFLLLVVGVGNGFAENTSRDSLFQEIKNARTVAKNWETIPGSDNDKLLAILTGKTIQVEDSRIAVCTRRFGVLLFQKVYYTRHIYYDETNKLLKQEMKFSQEKMNLPVAFIIFCLHGLLFCLLCLLTYTLYSERLTASNWMIWCILVSTFIYISYYLGTLCAIYFSPLYFQRWNQRKYRKLPPKKKRKERKEQKTKKRLTLYQCQLVISYFLSERLAFSLLLEIKN